jgi:hypothetical protein
MHERSSERHVSPTSPSIKNIEEQPGYEMGTVEQSIDEQ